MIGNRLSNIAKWSDIHAYLGTCEGLDVGHDCCVRKFPLVVVKVLDKLVRILSAQIEDLHDVHKRLCVNYFLLDRETWVTKWKPKKEDLDKV